MLRRLAIVLAGLLGLVVILVAAAFGYAQTQLGRDQIAGLLARQLGQPGQPAEIEGLAGLLPFDVRLGSLRLRDADGAWLEVDDARLQVRPAALLRGEIAVEQVGARRIALNRMPPSAPEPTSRSACRSCPSCRPACPASPSTDCSSMSLSWARPSSARPRPSLSKATPARAPTASARTRASPCAAPTSRPPGSTSRPGSTCPRAR